MLPDVHGKWRSRSTHPSQGLKLTQGPLEERAHNIALHCREIVKLYSHRALQDLKAGVYLGQPHLANVFHQLSDLRSTQEMPLGLNPTGVASCGMRTYAVHLHHKLTCDITGSKLQLACKQM